MFICIAAVGARARLFGVLLWLVICGCVGGGAAWYFRSYLGGKSDREASETVPPAKPPRAPPPPPPAAAPKPSQEGKKPADGAPKNRDETAYAALMKLGDKGLRSGNFPAAEASFQQALALRPNDQAASDLLRLAKDKIGYQRPPYLEDFSAVPVGGLPPGWLGDDTIGARRDGTMSWLQAAGEGSRSIRSPPLAFPESFELEIVLRSPENGFAVGIADERGLEGIAFFGGSGFHERGVALGDRGPRPPEANRPVAPGNAAETKVELESLGRLRLLREQGTYHLIVRDQHAAYRPAAVPDLNRLEFTLPGGQKATGLVRVSLSGDPRDRPIVPVAQLDENFTKATTGGLPRDWRGDGALAVARGKNVAWLQAAREGMYGVTTPPCGFPDRFVLDLALIVPCQSKGIELSLQGTWLSPDVIASLRRSGVSGGSNLQVGMTGAAPQERERSTESAGSPIALRIEREGDIYRLSLDGELIIAQRLPAYREFSSMRLRLDGPYDNQYTKLYKLRYTPLARGAPPPPASPLLHLDGRRPGTPGAGAVKGLTGRWRDSVGVVFDVVDGGQTLTLQLSKTVRGSSFSATLKKRAPDADGRVFYEGMADASFVAYPLPPKTVPIRIVVMGRDSLLVRISDWFEIDKSGKLQAVELHLETLTRN